MKKIILLIFLSIILSCNRSLDNFKAHQMIQEKFPDDHFIEGALDKVNKSDNKDFILPEISPFDLILKFFIWDYDRVHRQDEINKIIAEETKKLDDDEEK